MRKAAQFQLLKTAAFPLKSVRRLPEMRDNIEGVSPVPPLGLSQEVCSLFILFMKEANKCPIFLTISTG
jgi:hypothetical protein